eukprot:131218_1
MSDSNMSEDSTESEERKHTKRKYKKRDERYRPDLEMKVPSKPKSDAYGAPKRPLSSFLLYLQEQRSSVREEHPDLAVGEVTKLIGSQWSALTTDQKKPFSDKAESAMTDYKEERKNYERSAKFKRYKRALNEWNELYKEEYMEQQQERAMRRKQNKKRKKKKTVSKTVDKNKNKNK